jgi:MFS family permease
MPTDATSSATRWSMVGVALVVTASSFAFINAGAFLIPALKSERSTPLSQSGLLSAMPSLGMVLTLFAWGYLVDRLGERLVLAAGSALTAAASYAAASADSLLVIGTFLFLGGMAAGSCLPAGGRLVAGWFPAHQRGLAMGVRQTAQPLGIALGALAIPRLAKHHPPDGLLFPALACAVSAVAIVVVVRDPPRKPRTSADHAELANPYQDSAVLHRIHVVSALMTMPQYISVTFMLEWLEHGRGWSQPWAVTVVVITQLLGALSRISAGLWSDYVASRMRPVRTIALATGLGMMALALSDELKLPTTVAIMVTVSVITVMDNGLEATAITEFAGQYWSGRALGIQNTMQRVMALAGPPVFGALIVVGGYPLAFALCGLFPLAAAPVAPIGLVPAGLEDRAAQRAGARNRWWQTVRSHE